MNWTAIAFPGGLLIGGIIGGVAVHLWNRERVIRLRVALGDMLRELTMEYNVGAWTDKQRAAFDRAWEEWRK